MARKHTLSFNGKTFLAILLAVGLMALAGCSGGEQKPAPKAADQAPAATEAPAETAAKQELPPGHTPMDKFADDIQKMSHGNIKTQKEVKISQDVIDKWKEVQIEITDLQSNATANVTFAVGSTVKLNNEGLRLQVEHFVPDYTIVESRIESRSNEPNNPAVLVNLLDNEKSLTRGWVFRDYPEFNSFNDARFKLVLTSPAGKPAAAEGQK